MHGERLVLSHPCGRFRRAHSGLMREGCGDVADLQSSFVVIDVETTGLRPSDRVVEFAGAVLDGGGVLSHQVSTLVDPGRSPGPVGVHGITGEMLRGAPTFQLAAQAILHLLRGRVLVGHNLHFDWIHVRHEFRRLGLRLPVTSGGLCTAELARRVFGTPLTLERACALVGIEHRYPHRAASDVAATVQLFSWLRTELGDFPAHRPLLLARGLPSPQLKAPLKPRPTDMRTAVWAEGTT